MQPHHVGPDAEQRRRAFWAAVDGDPQTVVIVATEDEAGTMQLAGVFSTYGLAMDFAAKQCAAAVVMPKRVDDPTWGTVPLQ